jgi:hypothetical protein
LRRVCDFIGVVGYISILDYSRRTYREENANDLTNRWSQPLAAVKFTFDFMKQLSLFAALAAAIGGSALSR